MEKITHIYVYGDIVNIQASDPDYSDNSGYVSLTTVKNQFNQNPDCEEIVVHIHSYGGDVFEGFAIHDFLVGTGKKITTLVEGLCASIATVIFLAGEVRQLAENSRFLIHNPWIFTEGSADELEDVVAALRVEQKKLLDFYVKKTGGNAEELQTLMDKDDLIDAETAARLNFATVVIDTVKAAASLNISAAHKKIIFNSLKSKIKMKKTKKTKLEAMIASAKTLLGQIAGMKPNEEGNIQAASVELNDGTELYCEEESFAEGVAVFVDEELTEVAPDGTYTADNGDTIVVASGSVESITPADDSETPEATIARLTNELAAANARADENEVLATGLGESLESLQASTRTIMSNYKPEKRAATPNKPAASAGKKAKQDAAPKTLREQMKEEKAKMGK